MSHIDRTVTVTRVDLAVSLPILQFSISSLSIGTQLSRPTGGSAGSDTVLVLYPAFWPAGVAVSLGARELAAGDTVLGRATALVADAHKASPVAKVRAWRVPCGRAG